MVVPPSSPMGAGAGQPAAPAGYSERGLLVSPRGWCSPAPCCDASHVAFPLAAPNTFKNTHKDILLLEKQSKRKTNPSFRHRIIYTSSVFLYERRWVNILII